MLCTEGRNELYQLMAAIRKLEGLCQARCQQWAPAVGQIILLLDPCDHLVQKVSFQAGIVAILENCPACSVILSSQVPVVDKLNGKFKFTPHELQGLRWGDAARLFLDRLGRASGGRSFPDQRTRVR